ncbi:major pollen allergen Aln g 1-like [Alnus glutinosa]|uniref:major pollen allergen Aln g 1-like n=1 Tax=Alnus glutinosa TaxID=3517 RepID=UPI002D77B142|nr:major pollen allergen Aln g 1-like [Alnus glutinosa]XP_062176050.1 major pollen allergen Aln g 1-like [Alnus glutinosa]
MGVFNYEAETPSVIPAARLFKALILDGDNLIPKVAPQAVSSVENIEGNGGPGTIKKITFPEGSPFKYVKERVDEVDHVNFKYSYSVIEGGVVGDKLEKICNEIKIVAAPDGGSILKISNKYHTKGDHEMNAEQIKIGKEKAEGLFRAVESYLLAHSDAYN